MNISDYIAGDRRRRVVTVAVIHAITLLLYGQIKQFEFTPGFECLVVIAFFGWLIIVPFINGKVIFTPAVLENMKGNLFFRVSQVVFAAAILAVCVFGPLNLGAPV